jgi:flagellar motor switch protein FliN
MDETLEQASGAATDAAVAQFEELAEAMALSGSAPLSTLYDLSLPVAIELGRTAMTVQEVLHLGRGSVVELDRLAGEPVDVYVGDRRFAEGEVVVIGENFGVRITRVLPSGGGEAV